MTTSTTPPPAPSPGRAPAIAAVAIVAILAGTWLAHDLATIPAQALQDATAYLTDQTGQAVATVYRDGREVARRLLNGEVTTRFTSFVAETRQVNKLLLVEQTRLEHFHELHARGPSEAELDLFVPVEYQYFLDLADKSAWAMTVTNGELRVVAPPLQLQRPNPYWEERREFVAKGILIANEADKMAQLKDRVVAHATQLATRPARLAEARTAARESLATWLREWIESSLIQEYAIRAIAIRFADEPDFPAVRYGLTDPTPPFADQ